MSASIPASMVVKGMIISVNNKVIRVREVSKCETAYTITGIYVETGAEGYIMLHESRPVNLLCTEANLVE